MTIWKAGVALAALMTAAAAHAQTAPESDETTSSQEAGNDIVVVGQAVSFANTKVTEAMIDRQSALTSVNDVLNELPGVLVTEGDAFGSSDWATSITIRGFTTNRDTQQIGTTIDGLPNGGSGVERFTFGTLELLGGLDFTTLTIGLFALHIAGYPRQYGNALCPDFDAWIRRAGFRGRLVIVESVERMLSQRAAASARCAA